MSLIEVLVVAGLTLLIGAVLFQALQIAWTQHTRNLRHADLRQQAMIGSRRLITHLQMSTPAGIAAGPNQLTVQRLADVTATLPSTQIWDTRLFVYCVGPQGGLYWREWPPLPPDLGVTLSSSVPFRPSTAQLASLCVQNGSSLLGRDVISFELSSPSTLPITLRLTVQRDQETIISERTVSLRNAE